ncbi:MAG: putative repeat protein (TIGR01451 family) [Myxococcota bacterium]|jgi:uncharacterized repeat protein (TIGR01451 family)
MRITMALASLFLLSTAATAAPLVNDNTGTWTDTYTDNVGVDQALSVGVMHVASGRFVTLADGVDNGHYVSAPVAPSSFAAWKGVYLNYSALAAADISLEISDDAGGVWGPFPVGASTDAAFDGFVDLSAVPASPSPLRIKVTFARSGPIAPSVKDLQVRWVPRSVLRASIDRLDMMCERQTVEYRLRASVSYVDATNVVAWAPLPSGVANPDFGQASTLQFVKASDGGQLHAGPAPLAVHGHSIPPGSVWWDLGAKPAGNSFAVVFSVRTPVGVLAGTDYDVTAQVAASNADGVATVPVTTTVTAAPSPRIEKRASPVYTIDQHDYALQDSVVTYTLTAYNFKPDPVIPASCRETYHQAVVFDELSTYLDDGTFTGPPTNLTGNGQYTASGTTLHGITIPPKSVYWDVGALGVGARRTLSFDVQLAPETVVADDSLVINAATLASGYSAATHSGAHELRIGIPEDPVGVFLKGGPQTWPPRSFIGYGEPATFTIAFRNNGASAIHDVVILDKIPDDTVFSSAFMPSSAGGTVWYNTTGAGATLDAPPDFDPATGVFSGGSWSTSLPANPATVTWVAFRLPNVASQFFPEDGIPTLVSNKLTVTTSVPSGDCPDVEFPNTARVHWYGHTPVGDSQVTAQHGEVTDSHTFVAEPSAPDFSRSSITSSPGTLVGGGQVVYTIQARNTGNDTGLTDEVTILLPSASVNGVVAAMGFDAIMADGGTVDYSELPQRVTVRYPVISAGETKTISLFITVPDGIVDASVLRATASISGLDDLCGIFTSAKSANTTVRTNPELSVTKRSNLAIGAPSSQIDYAIRYVNTGDGPSTHTWVVDRVPDAVEFIAAQPGEHMTFWFSNALPPTLPTDFADFFVWDTAAITASGLFQPGMDAGGGTVTSPYGAQTTWVAISLDDQSLSPPQLVTDALREAVFTVNIADDAALGNVVANEAGIISRENELAVSNKARTQVSGNPSLSVDRSCPNVVAVEQSFAYQLAFVNNSSNVDSAVVLQETLPPEFTYESVDVVWNAATEGAYDGVAVTPTVDASGALVFDITGAIAGPLPPLQGGTLVITASVATGAAAGEFATISGLGSALNEAVMQPVTLFTECSPLVENTDLSVTKTVDVAAPLPGETVTFTLTIANRGAFPAANVSIADTLPPELAYVAGSAQITTPGWSLSSGIDPVPNVGVMRWDVAADNALTGPDSPAGALPGRSPAIGLTYRAIVGAAVPPDTTLTNCVTVDNDIFDDGVYTNTDCVDVRTPQPDPYVVKDGPSVAQPGGAVTYTLRYGNASRMPTAALAVVDPLPDLDADGVVDVTLLAATARNGQTIWYSDAPLTGTAPSFDPADTTGWETAPGSLAGAVTHVAVATGPLAGNSGPFVVYLDVELRAPASGLLPQPGSTITNCATIQGGAADDDPSNNTDCVETRTPGVDVALVHTCDPEGGFPGVRPGEPMALTLTAVNNGTELAHGLSITEQLPTWFEVLGDNAITVVVNDASGNPASAIDATGTPVTGAVPWTQVGSTYLLGSDDASSPFYYRAVGLAPGHSASVTISGLVATSPSSNTAIVNTATIATDYRFDWVEGDPVEENLDNNEDSCGTTVYRPDPMVLKDSAPVGEPGAVAGTERIGYTITYGNIGQADADDVVIEDTLPSGTYWVVGSLANIPDDAHVEFDDGSGAWTHQLVGETGAIDAAVTAVRVVWDAPMTSPTNNFFSQASVLDFAAGAFSGTATDSVLDGVVVRGSPGDGTEPSYLSPPVPGAGDGTVVTWERVVALVRRLEADDGITLNLVDAATGEVIAGYADLTPDGSGAVDISGLDPNAYPAIRVEATFSGGGFRVDLGTISVTPIEALVASPAPVNAVFTNRDESMVVGALDVAGVPWAAVWVRDDSDPSGFSVAYLTDTAAAHQGLALSASNPVLLDNDGALHVYEVTADGAQRTTLAGPSGMNLLFAGDTVILAQESVDSARIWTRAGDRWDEVAFPMPNSSWFWPRTIGPDGSIGGRCYDFSSWGPCMLVPDAAAPLGWRHVMLPRPPGFESSSLVRTESIHANGTVVGWVWTKAMLATWMPDANEASGYRSALVPHNNAQRSTWLGTSQDASVIWGELRYSSFDTGWPWTNVFWVRDDSEASGYRLYLPETSGSTRRTDLIGAAPDGSWIAGRVRDSSNIYSGAVWISDGGAPPNFGLQTLSVASGLTTDVVAVLDDGTIIATAADGQYAFTVAGGVVGAPVKITDETAITAGYRVGGRYVGLADGSLVTWDSVGAQHPLPRLGLSTGRLMGGNAQGDLFGVTTLTDGSAVPTAWIADVGSAAGWRAVAIPDFDGMPPTLSGVTPEGIAYGLYSTPSGGLPVTWQVDTSVPGEIRTEPMPRRDYRGTWFSGVWGFDYSVNGGLHSAPDGRSSAYAYWYASAEHPSGLALAEAVAPAGHDRPYLQGHTQDYAILWGRNDPTWGEHNNQYVATIWVKDAAEASGHRAIALPDGGWESAVFRVEDDGVVLGKAGMTGSSPQVPAIWRPDDAGGYTFTPLGSGDGEARMTLPGGVVFGVESNVPMVWVPDGEGYRAVSVHTLPGSNDSANAMAGSSQDLHKQGLPIVTYTPDGFPGTLAGIVVPDASASDGYVLMTMGGEGQPSMGGNIPFRVAPNGDVVGVFFGERNFLSIWRRDDAEPSGYRHALVKPDGNCINSDYSYQLHFAPDSSFIYPFRTHCSDPNADPVFFIVRPDSSEPSGYLAQQLPPEIGSGGENLGNELDQFRPVADTGCWFAPPLGGSTLTLPSMSIVGCAVRSSAVLDAWSVRYRTDKNPSFGYQLELGRQCQSSVTNTATVSTSTPEIATTNNSASASDDVETVDLGVEIGLLSPGTVATGAWAAFTMTVTNHGPGVSTPATLTATLPPQLPAGDRSFAVPALQVGETITFEWYSENIATESGTLLVVNAEVAHTGVDCNVGNDTTSQTFVVGNFPNVWVTKTGPASVRLGEVFEYFVLFGNTGNAVAENVVMMDVLPPGMVLADPGAVTAIDMDIVEPFQEVGVHIPVRVDDCAYAGADVTNVAEVSAEVDIDVADNQASATTRILGPAATLEVALVPSRASAEIGDTLTYVAYVRNGSSALVEDATVTVAVPDGLSVVLSSVSGSGAPTAGQIIWSLGDVAPGAQGAVSFQAAVTSAMDGASLVAAASADGGNTCPVESASVPVVVTAPGLHLLKSADLHAACGVDNDDVMMWTLQVTNTSGADVSGVVVADVLPAGTEYVAGSMMGLGGNDAGAPTLIWDVGTVPAGQGLTLSYQTSQPGGRGNLVTNVASLEVDGVRTRESNPAAVRVDCQGSLELTKRWDGQCAVAGDTIALEIGFENTSDGPLSDVVVSDHVAQGLADVQVLTPGATYIPVNRLVVWPVGDVAVGERGTLMITGVVQAGFDSGEFLTGRATATSAEGAPQASNQVGGVLMDCDDGDFCTVDTCSPLVGCVNMFTEIDVADDTCDNVDDNCNGVPDDDYMSVQTQCGVGSCASDGDTACVDGDVIDDCMPGAPETERCDGDDNDCDGAVDAADEDLVLVTCDLTDGVCAGSMKSADLCVDGDWVACGDAVYVAWAFGQGLTYTTDDATCDAVDNNCDGTDDDDYAPTATECGLGECAGNTGELQCVEGAELDTCAPLDGAVVEACNALDDSCDGTIDLDSNRMTVCTPIATATECAEAPVGALPLTLTFSDPGDADADRFDCAVNGGPWQPCNDGSWTFTEASVGQNTFLVRRVGPDGAVDTTPAFCVWEYDPNVPEAWCAAQPDDPSQTREALLTFASNVADSPTYYCVLDPEDAEDTEGYDACETTVSYSELADGHHEVCVYVVNQAGTADTTPECCGWTIDTALPSTDLVCDVTLHGTDEVGLSFSSAAQDLVGFECRWDGADWSACSAPVITSELADGAHTFEVRAIDESGNVDPTPASCAFTVDTTPPTTACAVAPTDPSQSAGAVFGFASGEEGVAFECVLDPTTTPPGAQDWVSCEATVTYEDLSDGRHAVWVRAVDAAGNTDASAEECAWTIDTTFPETEISEGPPALTSPTEDAVLAYADPTDPTIATFECRLDGGAWVRCDDYTTTYGADELALGEHGVEVRTCLVAIDRCDPTPAFHVWTVVESPCPRDTTAPTLTCDEDLVLECADGGALADLAVLNASATDACEPISVATEADATMALGANPVVWVASDGNGNVSNCLSIITVADTMAPQISCREDITLTTEPGVCTAAVAIAGVIATDACDADETLNLFTDDPDRYNLGATVVTGLAVDSAGNVARCEFTVTVVDNEPLVLACDATYEVEAAPDRCDWSGEVSATATDNCAGELTVTEVPTAYPVGVTAVDFEAEDQDGNSDSCQTNVVVSDVTPPTVTCGDLDDALRARIIGADACGVALNIDAVNCLKSGGTEQADSCPVTIEGDTLTVGAGIGQRFEVHYQAVAVDPSGNETVLDCALQPHLDTDVDGVLDADDNCPTNANSNQLDLDLDGQGDACDATAADGLVADGGGGCASGSSPLPWAGLVALLTLAALRRRKRSMGGAPLACQANATSTVRTSF